MAAYLCLIALVFVVINLVVDLLYYAVDPRLRIAARGTDALTTPEVDGSPSSTSRSSTPS